MPRATKTSTGYQVRMSPSGQTTVPKPIRDALRLSGQTQFNVSLTAAGEVVFTPYELAAREVVAAYAEAVEDERAGRLSGPFGDVEALTAHLRRQSSR
jgi:bifunctional DNA-binding transcriptional regulator/antitoxin component of YhaV-PrlF toxin-antitoxin module